MVTIRSPTVAPSEARYRSPIVGPVAPNTVVSCTSAAAVTKDVALRADGDRLVDSPMRRYVLPEYVVVVT